MICVIDNGSGLTLNVQNLKGRSLKAFSGISQFQFSAACEKLAAEFRFHPQDQPAESLLGNMELVGGFRDAAFFRYGQKIFKVLKIHGVPSEKTIFAVCKTIIT